VVSSYLNKQKVCEFTKNHRPINGKMRKNDRKHPPHQTGAKKKRRGLRNSAATCASGAVPLDDPWS